MKKILTTLLYLFFIANIFAQQTKLYNPEADAATDISNAIKKAKEEHKFILLQAGGNWCSWCIEFARFCKADPTIDSLINNSFVWYHLNYSKENRNKKIFEQYAFPQRFGFPVFIILDENGQRVHTQSSEYLENGKKSYDKNKVMSFLEMWSPAALDAGKYEE
ncbi:MAG: thioredoxin family protein [Chitinophagaceae bacterium]|nr:thioredoxin family protein [Chitinophagaceae bacterium]